MKSIHSTHHKPATNHCTKSVDLCRHCIPLDLVFHLLISCVNAPIWSSHFSAKLVSCIQIVLYLSQSWSILYMKYNESYMKYNESRSRSWALAYYLYYILVTPQMCIIWARYTYFFFLPTWPGCRKCYTRM